MLGAAAAALGFSATANAEPAPWPQQRPAVPATASETTATQRFAQQSYPSSSQPIPSSSRTYPASSPPSRPFLSPAPSAQPSSSQSAASQPASPPPQSAPPQTTQSAAQPASGPAERRPASAGSSAAAAQAAVACMNEQKSASVDAAIKGCDTVIDQTLKNLANAYYFRAGAKLGKNDFDGASATMARRCGLTPRTPTISTVAAPPTKPRTISTKRSPTTTRRSRPTPIPFYAYNSRGAAYQRKGDFARAAADYAR